MKRLVAVDRQHVRHVALCQPAPQVPVLTVDLVGTHPRGRYPASSARASILLASCGLVWNATVSGMPVSLTPAPAPPR